MTCKCITNIEAELPEHKLDVAIAVRGNTLVAETYTPLERRDNGKKETRSRKPHLVAHKFCPFCGVSYAAPAELAEKNG